MQLYSTLSDRKASFALPVVKKLSLSVSLLFMLASAQAQTVYAIQGNSLISFAAGSPGTISSTVAISGITTGQVIEGLDFRPSTGQLYALGYKSSTGEAQVYTINLSNGVGMPVGSSITLAASMADLSFDFSPVADRIRVTSSAGNNYRLNPVNGTIAATDPSLNYASADPHFGASPGVRAVAYTNSYGGATTTTQYYYDLSVNSLGFINPPNSGTLTTVGSSGVAPLDGNGLDMDIIFNQGLGTNTAYLSAHISGSANNFYTVNLSTGAATLVGTIGGGATISEMAVLASAPSTPPLYTIYAVTAANYLISFNSTSPSTILSSVQLKGIASGQAVEGLDFRPADGQLYALGYKSSTGEAQLYKVNTSTGIAAPVGSTIALATGMSRLSFDFNPVSDRVRVTSAGGQNYRLDPGTGGLAATDVSLNYPSGDIHVGASPAVNAVAYTNNYSGGGPTTLYYYDLSFNSIGVINPPNNGSLSTVAATNLAGVSANGLDMDIVTNQTSFVNTAFLSANVSGSSNNLFTLDLTTGAPSFVGTIGTGAAIIEMAVASSAPVSTPPPSHTIYAISGTNLVSFNSTTPGTISSTVTITGVSAGQVIEGLDFRPADGQLYALGYKSSTGEAQVYKVNTTTGAFTPVGSSVTLAASMTSLSFDFNPVVDRIRVTSKERNNYRLNPLNGALVATDGTLNYPFYDAHSGATPSVYTLAYTNSYPGAASTALYSYDLSFNHLAVMVVPNAGELNTNLSTGIAPIDGSGLDMDIVTDINSGVNTVFLSGNFSGSSIELYAINLSTGVTSLVGTIGSSISELAVALTAPPPPPAYPVYALTSTGNLIAFDSNTPGTIFSSLPVTGIASGQVIEGLDFRPATGGLYALGYNAGTGEAQIYILNKGTGAATPVGGPITLATNMGRISFDFNPMVDRIRVTGSNGGNNYRLDPATGALAATDVSLAYAASDIHNGASVTVYAVAYNNNFSGAGTTSLYFFDSAFNNIGIINPPNNGSLNTVATTGLSPVTGAGMDMDIATDQSSMTHTAFAIASPLAGVSNFYTINLGSGLPVLIGNIGGGTTVTEMAVNLTGGILPVKLTNFGVAKKERAALVSWTTQAEINNDYFIVERSEDGTVFHPVSGHINSQAANGNSNSALNYNSIDNAPVNGWNYYRLLQVDRNGKREHSSIVRLKFDGAYEISLSPNPVHAYLNIAGVSNNKSRLKITIVNAGGINVFTEEKTRNAGSWNQQLNLSSFTKGAYFISVFNNGEKIYTETIIKD
jgi:hypothetical protein